MTAYRVRKLAAICVLLAVASSSRSLWWAARDHLLGPGPKIAWSTSLDQSLARAAKEKKPLLVEFSAAWCGPCQTLKHETFHDTEVARRLNTEFIPVQIDVDQQKALAARFGVSGIPDIAILDSNGDEIARVAGYRNASDFLRLLDAAEKRFHSHVSSPWNRGSAPLPPLPPMLP